MTKPIDFYFDYSSPYGYFAAMKIDDLAARHGRGVNWKPILLGAVFKVTGAQPLPSLPLKGDYARRDIARSARFHGIRINHPSKFPIATQAPARAFYWLNDRDPALARKLAKILYQAYFVEDRDISSPEVTAGVAATLIKARHSGTSLTGGAARRSFRAPESPRAVPRATRAPAAPWR